MNKIAPIFALLFILAISTCNCYFIKSIGETKHWTSYNITNASQIPAENMSSIKNYGDYTQLANGNLVIGFQSIRKDDNYYDHNFVAFDQNGQFIMFKNMKADEDGVIALIHTNVDNEVFYARSIINQDGKSEVRIGFFNLEGQITRGAADHSPISLDDGDETFEPLTKRGNNLIYLLTYLYDDSQDSELLYLHVFDISKQEKYVTIYNHRLDEYKYNFYFAYTLTVYQNQTAIVQAYNNDESGNPVFVKYKFDQNGKKEHGYPQSTSKVGPFKEDQSQNARSYTYLNQLNNQMTTIYSDKDSEFVIATSQENGELTCVKQYNVEGIDMNVLYYGVIDNQVGWIQTVDDLRRTIYYLFNPNTCDFDGEQYMVTMLYDSISGPYIDLKSRKIGVLEIGNNYQGKQEVVQVFQHQIGSISKDLVQAILNISDTQGCSIGFLLSLMILLMLNYM